MQIAMRNRHYILVLMVFLASCKKNQIENIHLQGDLIRKTN